MWSGGRLLQFESCAANTEAGLVHIHMQNSGIANLVKEANPRILLMAEYYQERKSGEAGTNCARAVRR